MVRARTSARSMSERPLVGSSSKPREAGFSEMAMALREKSRRRKVPARATSRRAAPARAGFPAKTCSLALRSFCFRVSALTAAEAPAISLPGPAALRARVMRFINLLQPLLDDMCINLSSGNVGVAENELNRSKVRTALEQVRGKTVSQHMRRKRYTQNPHPYMNPKNLPHPDL